MGPCTGRARTVCTGRGTRHEALSAWLAEARLLVAMVRCMCACIGDPVGPIGETTAACAWLSGRADDTRAVLLCVVGPCSQGHLRRRAEKQRRRWGGLRRRGLPLALRPTLALLPPLLQRADPDAHHCPDHGRLHLRRGTRRRPFNSAPMGVKSISFGSPHVRPSAQWASV